LLASIAPEGECVGLERDPALLAAARHQSGRLPVRFEAGDATQLPFADHSFDFVFARYLMMHLPSLETAVREMLRVARRGGKVMLVEPDFSFQAAHPPSWAYERLAQLLAALLPDPFIGRKLGHLLRQSGAGEVHLEAASGIEQGDSTVRRTWRMTVEAMGPAMLSKNILTAEELTALIAEFRRVEQDPGTVLLYNPVVCASTQIAARVVNKSRCPVLCTRRLSGLRYKDAAVRPPPF
jgi:SAM-dependent methyltransferase